MTRLPEWERQNATYQGSGPGLANRWPRLDLAPRHIFFDLYNILEIS